MSVDNRLSQSKALRLRTPATGAGNFSEARSIDSTALRDADSALWQGEQPFRALIESFGGYVWQVDENAHYNYVSSGVKAALGYEPEELIGKSPFAIMAPEEAKRVAAVFTPIVAEHRGFALLQNIVLHKDGREIVLETSGLPVFDERRTFRGFFGMDRDVTEQRRAARELAESEAKFHTIFDAEADGILIADVLTRKFILANPAMCKMLGYSLEELLQLGAEDVLPPAVYRETADYFGKVQEREDRRSLEVTMKRKDGSQIIVMIIASPMTLGGRLYSIGLFRDITARRRQDEMLREEKERWKGLVEQNVACVVIALADGTIAYANPYLATLSDTTVSDALGRSLLDFVPASERPGVQKIMTAQQSSQDGVFQFTMRLLSKRGTVFDVLVNSSRVTFEGKPASIAIVLDITERKRAEEALRTSERNLSIALQMARAGYWEYDVASDQFLFNDNFYGIFRTTAKAVGGYTMRSAEYARRFVHPDDIGIVAAEIKAAMETAEANYCREIEHRIVYADGASGYVTVRFFADKDERGRTVRTYGVNQDITARKLGEEALRRLNRALRTLSTGNATLVRAEREQDFLEAMCRILVDVGGYAAAWIGYAESDEAKTVRPVAWAGDHADFIMRAQISWADVERGRGPVGLAIRSGKPIVNADFASNPSMVPWRTDALEHGFVANIALPLTENDATFGALTIYAQERGAFDPEEVKLLTEFSGDLAFGIAALRTRGAREEGVARLRKAMTSTVLALAATVERRDPYTAGHQRNVARLASAIAAKIDVSPQERDGIYLAAVIHDIGKVQIPGEILSKPGRLTSLEFDLVKTHAQAGYDIVKGIDFPWPVADIILQHHERLDGSGYPHGLKGDAILTGARILAVADVVEAMTAFRPYRPGLGLDAALAEITNGRGVQYDTAAVDACIDLIRNEGFTFDKVQ